jgi:hypothetical protein
VPLVPKSIIKGSDIDPQIIHPKVSVEKMIIKYKAAMIALLRTIFLNPAGSVSNRIPCPAGFRLNFRCTEIDHEKQYAKLRCAAGLIRERSYSIFPAVLFHSIAMAVFVL